MKALTAAIMVLFNADSTFKTAISSRLYNRHAPQGTDFPYAIFSYPTGVPDNLFDSKIIEDVTWQLDIYSKDTDPLPALTLYEQATALFDFAELTISGYGHLHMKREMQSDLSEPNDAIRRWVIQYNILMSKN